MALRPLSNPTLATIVKIQTILEDAGEPLTRYELHKRLGGSVNYPVLESVLNYLAMLRLVVDEGKGGKVLWVHAVRPNARQLFASSRRVA